MHPDQVMWSNTKQVVILVELTVCFETNFVDASARKVEKYQDLLEACTASGYSTSIVTLEVGSRGFLNIHGFQKSPFSNQLQRRLFWIAENLDSS